MSTLSATPAASLAPGELSPSANDPVSISHARETSLVSRRSALLESAIPLDLIYRAVQRIGIPSRAKVLSLIARKSGFHQQMVYASISLLTLTFAACRFTSIRLDEPFNALLAIAIAILATLPLPLYWHEKGKENLREAAFTINWGLLMVACVPFLVAIAGRIGAVFPMKDSRFALLDQSLGVNVPRIMAFAERIGVAYAINRTYTMLSPFVLFAFLFPALTGKPLPAQRFITSNLIAFAIGLPLFILFPAAGPWSGYHFPPGPDRFACEAGLLQLRQAGPYIFHPAGVVCFPSFHVIWAVLAAHTLWGFRWLRIPAAVLAGLIIVSTMTLGWHYFIDVLAGLIVASAAVILSRLLPQ